MAAVIDGRWPRQTGARRPVRNDTIANTMNTKNRIFAIPAAPAAMPKNPKNPPRARARKTRGHSRAWGFPLGVHRRARAVPRQHHRASGAPLLQSSPSEGAISQPKNIPREADEVSGVSDLLGADEPQGTSPTLQSRPDPPRSGPVSRPPPSSDRRPLVAGSVIGGRYRLDREIGSGGMGEVWAGQHLSLRMSVAVKVLLPRSLDVPEIVARFEREALLLGRLRSDHAQRAVDFFVDDAYGPVLVTELIDGKSLAEAIKRPSPSSKPSRSASSWPRQWTRSIGPGRPPRPQARQRHPPSDR